MYFIHHWQTIWLFITNEIGSVVEAKRLLKLCYEYIMINGYFNQSYVLYF
jgi:hypothetical protein